MTGAGKRDRDRRGANSKRSRRLLSARGRSLEITKAGWLLIGLTLLVGFAAINSGSNLLHVLFGALMALIIGSGILSEQVVRRARARRLADAAVHARTPATLRVQLENTDPRADLLSVSVEDDDRHASPDRCAPVFAVRVPPGRTVELVTTLTMQQRGRHPLPRAVVATRFPFGLFVKRRELPSPPEILVFPRIRPVPRRDGRDERPGAGESMGRVARVGEFFGLREYRDGDDPRRIYWRALARNQQRPVVREHEALGDRELVLDLPPGRTGDPAFEDTVETVASLAVAELEAPGIAVGLRYGGAVVVEPGSGAAHRHRLLEFLATVGAA